MEEIEILLLEYLGSKGYSGGDARKMMRSGKVKVFGVPTADAARLVQAKNVAIVPNAPRMAVGKDPAVVFRDSSLVVVWKPPRYLSVPAAGRKGEPSVLTFVRRLFGTAFAVHRLDEVTSGLMLVALEEGDQLRLKEFLAKKKITRQYLAIVAGKVSEAFQVENTLVRDRGDGLRGSTEEEEAEDGKLASTSFRPLDAMWNATLVEATLDTGRTHQVRIHLAEAGFPILGEHLYGNPGVEGRASRLCLHAHRLCFPHPRTGEANEFRAPLADDMNALCRRLKAGPTKRHKGSAMKKKRKKKRG